MVGLIAALVIGLPLLGICLFMLAEQNKAIKELDHECEIRSEKIEDLYDAFVRLADKGEIPLHKLKHFPYLQDQYHNDERSVL